MYLSKKICFSIIIYWLNKFKKLIREHYKYIKDVASEGFI